MMHSLQPCSSKSKLPPREMAGRTHSYLPPSFIGWRLGYRYTNTQDSSIRMRILSGANGLVVNGVMCYLGVSSKYLRESPISSHHQSTDDWLKSLPFLARHDIVNAIDKFSPVHRIADSATNAALKVKLQQHTPRKLAISSPAAGTTRISCRCHWLARTRSRSRVKSERRTPPRPPRRGYHSPASSNGRWTQLACPRRGCRTLPRWCGGRRHGCASGPTRTERSRVLGP